MPAPGKTGSEYKQSNQERDNRSHDDTYGVNVVLPVAEYNNGVYRLKADGDGNLLVSNASGAGTSAVTSVNDTSSSTTLKSSNASRKEIIIQNTSSAILYIKYGTTASSTDFTVSLAQNDILIEDKYTGRIDGIWASDPNDGAAKITEMT